MAGTSFMAIGAQPEAVATSETSPVPTETISVPNPEPLWIAATAGDCTKIEQLLKSGVLVNARDKKFCGYTALLYALREKHAEAVKTLLKHGAQDDRAFTCATAGGPVKAREPAWSHGTPDADPLDCITALIAAGADVNKYNPQMSASAINIAVETSPAILQAILAAHPDLNTVNSRGETPLYASARYGHKENFRILLAEGADPNLGNANHDTPLITLAGQRDVELMRLILAAHPKINAINNAGQSALAVAAASFHTEMVKMLLKAGADVNLENDWGETALTAALRNEAPVDLLKAAGAKKLLPPARRNLHFYNDLSPARTWALATTAMMQELAGAWRTPEIPGAAALTPWDGGSFMLDRIWDKNWGITDRESLLAWLDNCEKNGDRLDLRKHPRMEFHKAISSTKQLNSTFAAAFSPKSAKTPLVPLKKTVKEDNRYLAWDLCNYISAVRLGFFFGYLSKDEAWQKIMPVAERIQANFGSWQEMGRDFVDGYEQKNARADHKYGLIVEMLLNPADQNSPWTACAWTTPLSESAAQQ